QVTKEGRLKRLAREGLTDHARPVVDVVLAPEPEADLQERDARISIVSLRETFEELEMKRLQLGVCPIREHRAHTFGIPDGLVVVGERFQILRHGGLAPRIDVIEAHYGLV